MTAQLPPFSSLTPECILDAVAAVGFIPSGSLLALNSYENRVYQVGIDEGSPVVVKFYRPDRWSDAQIEEEHAFVAVLAEREIPVVAPLAVAGHTLHQHAGYRFAVFERRGGRVAEPDRPGVLQWLGRFLGRIHAVGAVENYQVRPALDLDHFGTEPRAWLLSGDAIPAEQRTAYAERSQQVLDFAKVCFARAGEVTQLRLHGDCHPANILWTDAGPHFVDFDDSRMGPAIQDLWMLLSGERADQQRQLQDLLAGYEDFRDFNARELYLIEALRSLRMIYFSAWLARRWHDPAFPAAFPWFGSAHYWEQKTLELEQQLVAMDQPPLWPV